MVAPDIDTDAHEATTIEFVGSLSGFDAGAAESPPSHWASDEKTALYRPQRARLPEEATEEFDLEAALEQSSAGPPPRKVIVAPAVLAGLPADPARAEPTKKRRGRRRARTTLSVALCLLGSVALLLSAAWRYPMAVSTVHAMLVRVAAMVSSLYSG
jgi:hypothetical protein